MRERFIRRLLPITLLWLLIFGTVGSASLPTIEIEIPGNNPLRAEKIIFSGNGAKFAILINGQDSAFQRYQIIYIYDFVAKEWKKGIESINGVNNEFDLLTFNHDGSQLALRIREDIIVLDTVNDTMTHYLTSVGSMTRAAFSFDGRYLAFLDNAEWEKSTSLAVIDLQGQADKYFYLAKYEGESKAAGPLVWTRDGKGVYFIEEFTWGTINAKGVLKQYSTVDGSVKEIYNSNTHTTRVTRYYHSPNEQYMAMILRDLDANMQNSRFGLLIQQKGQFVYGKRLDGWSDELDLLITTVPSVAGWLGNNRFYWVTRTETGSSLYIYSISEDQLMEYHYDQQIYVTPLGIVIKLGR